MSRVPWHETRPRSEQAAPTSREMAAPAQEGSEAEVRYRKQQLPWIPRRTGWWNLYACKSCGPGDVESVPEAGLGADGRGVGREENLGVGRDGCGELRMGLGSRIWEMAPSGVCKFCEVLVGAVLVKDNNISDCLFCSRLCVQS